MEELTGNRFFGSEISQWSLLEINETENEKWLVELRARLIEACIKGQNVKYLLMNPKSKNLNRSNVTGSTSGQLPSLTS